MNWAKSDEVDWNDIFENGKNVLVFGCRSSLKDEFFQVEHWDYACGTVHTLGEEDLIIESMQGEVCFLIEKITHVMIIKKP